VDKDLPPDWAISRTIDLVDSSRPVTLAMIKASPSLWPTSISFARYIAEHETPPVSPELLSARYAWAKSYERASNPRHASKILAGDYDTEAVIQAMLEAIESYKIRIKQQS
jgi:hypothetical protein